MPLKIDITERKKDHYTIRLEGRLDTTTTPDCEKRVNPLLKTARSLVLDLDKLEYISSMGLRLVLGLRKALHARKGKVLMTRPQPQIVEVLKVAQILPDTDIFDNVESADIFLDAVQRKELLKNTDLVD